jgi:hypothetical protein
MYINTSTSDKRSIFRKNNTTNGSIVQWHRALVIHIDICFGERGQILNCCNLTEKPWTNLSCIKTHAFSGAILRKIFVTYFKLRNCELFARRTTKELLDIEGPNQVILRKNNTCAQVKHNLWIASICACFISANIENKFLFEFYLRFCTKRIALVLVPFTVITSVNGVGNGSLGFH